MARRSGRIRLVFSHSPIRPFAHSPESDFMVNRFAISSVGVLLLAASVQAQPPDLTGRWSGRWESDKNGHSGPLHARFRQLDCETYRVAFRGRFWGVFPFYYRTT